MTGNLFADFLLILFGLMIGVLTYRAIFKKSLLSGQCPHTNWQGYFDVQTGRQVGSRCVDCGLSYWAYGGNWTATTFDELEPAVQRKARINGL